MFLDGVLHRDVVRQQLRCDFAPVVETFDEIALTARQWQDS